MIRIVTAKRLARLEADTHAAFDRARQTSEAASAAVDRHTCEMQAATASIKRLEAESTEAGERLAHTVAELAAAEEDLRRREIEVQRLREELEAGPSEGDSLTVLLHYGEPHTVYASHAEAKADTATHGVTEGAWVTGDERMPAEVQWRLEAFTYDAAANGFRRVFVPAQRRVGEAA
ncbi:hypothetical protein OG746_03785 [Streptomyces sp. NBC_01016]|uniref:hypothetical protein n=1 Tax=unclassified Streptomyces TaxID=2593676 RepID=UPI002250DF06|nr:MULTISPECIES: hypothetical protein [unclassified Streptomyces]MCX4827858.1 hypothetical protein [Streptomyces sp. NBC_01016]